MFEFRPYQIAAANKLSDILVSKRFALDASDTGVGKTYTAIKTILEFDSVDGSPAPVAVICRANSVTKWQKALDQFNLKPVFLMSWDKARNKKNGFFIPTYNRRGKVNGFNLRLRDVTIVIIDEIHAAGGLKSLASEIVIAAKRCPHSLVLGLSASVADTPLKMKAVGFCCGLHSLGDDYFNWCRRNGCGKSPFGGMYFRKKDREKVLTKLHHILFSGPDAFGIRLRKKELMEEGQFPESETYVELWDVSKPPAWLKPWTQQIEEAEERDMEKHDWDPHAGILAMRDRQRSEMLKVPSLIEEIEDRLEEGESPIIFLQFTRTLALVSERLSHINHSVIAGKVSRPTPGLKRYCRDTELGLFQTNQHRLILCQTDAGSESIDLHDTDGRFPRHVILFPTYKSVTLLQALGRAVRSGTKASSPVIQRIVYAAGGIEEKIASVVERRLENLSLLSDGELNAGGML